MSKRRNISSLFFLSVAVCAMVCFLTATPAWAQAGGNLPVDLSATSALCGGQECFNWAGMFANGFTFLGTAGMDNGNNCTPTPPYTNCPDAYSGQQLFGSSFDPNANTAPTLTIGGVPFDFGLVNSPGTQSGASGCGASGEPNCILDMINLKGGGGTTITLAPSDQVVYSTMVMLGTAVNGHHLGTVIVTYTDNTTNSFSQTFSDWCGFGGNQYESIGVSGVERINSDGTLNGANCNLYEYTYPLDVTRELQSITLKDSDGSGAMFALAITLKPPTYTIDGGVANPQSIGPGSSTTAMVTVSPQPGYVGTIQLSCGILPAIQTGSAATAPSCSLNPTSVTVTSGEQSPPATSLTFTSAPAAQAALAGQGTRFYAFWLPIPGLALAAFGFGGTQRRKKLLGLLLLGLLLAGVVVTPACMSYTHLGNVGTPPGVYTVAITGVDENGLTQASNPAGTSNTVIVTVSGN